MDSCIDCTSKKLELLMDKYKQPICYLCMDCGAVSLGELNGDFIMAKSTVKKTSEYKQIPKIDNSTKVIVKEELKARENRKVKNDLEKKPKEKAIVKNKTKTKLTRKKIDKRKARVEVMAKAKELKKIELNKKIIELRKSNKKRVEIAEILNIPLSTLSNYIAKLNEEGIIENREDKSIQLKSEIIKLRKANKKKIEIAEILDIPLSTLGLYIIQLEKDGLIKNRKVKLQELKSKILKLRKENKSSKEIAKILGKSKNSINSHIGRMKKDGLL